MKALMLTLIGMLAQPALGQDKLPEVVLAGDETAV